MNTPPSRGSHDQAVRHSSHGRHGATPCGAPPQECSDAERPPVPRRLRRRTLTPTRPVRPHQERPIVPVDRECIASLDRQERHNGNCTNTLDRESPGPKQRANRQLITSANGAHSNAAVAKGEHCDGGHETHEPRCASRSETRSPAEKSRRAKEEQNASALCDEEGHELAPRGMDDRVTVVAQLGRPHAPAGTRAPPLEHYSSSASNDVLVAGRSGIHSLRDRSSLVTSLTQGSGSCRHPT